MLGLQVRNQLTGKRLILLVILIGAEAFLLPMSTLLSEGVWPTSIQVAHAAITAGLQIVTLAIVLLKKEAA